MSLRLNRPVDAVVTGAATLSWLAAETVLEGAVAPSSCRWCDPPGLDRRIRSGLKWDDTSAAGAVGLAGFVAAPVVAFGLLAAAAAHDGRARDFWDDALIVGEAVSVTMFLTTGVKLAVARERPAAHFAQDRPLIRDSERNLSFFSGHSSLAFSFATAAGTVASMRRYRWATWVWATGLAIATVTAYSRIAADRHYFTDVIAGSAVGAGIGFALPWFLHGRF